MKNLVEFIFNPNKVANHILYRYLSRIISSDTLYLRLMFRLKMGYWPNLKNPQTFSEKLQWLKIHNRKPIMTDMVDKVEAKKYVSEIIGSEYIIPTLGVYNAVDEIDFNALPNQFVLKCTHDSGGLVVCRNKDILNVEVVKKKLLDSLKKNYYYRNREWPYKNVIPRIIAEQYIEDNSGNGLTDYKFFCFNGNPQFLYVSYGLDNHSTARMSFLNTDWTFSPFCRSDYEPHEKLPEKPQNYELMLDIARQLSKGFPHVRVDLYNIEGSIYFGEMTFYTCSGLIPFKPKEWDLKLGEYITLH